MNLIQHRTDLTEIGLLFTGYFPFPDFWSLGSGISAVPMMLIMIMMLLIMMTII